MSNVKKSNTSTMDEVHKKFNLTQWGSHTIRSILRRNMKIIKNAPKHILWSFWRFSVTIICDIEFDLRVCKSHYIEVIPHQVPHTNIKVICWVRYPTSPKNFKVIRQKVPYLPKKFKVIHQDVPYAPKKFKVICHKVPYTSKKCQSNSLRCTYLPKKFQSNSSRCTLPPKKN